MSITGKYWDRPWSLVNGCTPCSPGCDHCWSMAMGKRFHRWPDIITPRRDRLNIPLKVKKPTVWAIWNDLCHKNVPTEFIWDTFKVMGGAWHHTYLILTKRAERLKAIHEINPLLRQEGRSPMGKIWDHVWIGVTVCNQAEADEKIPLLLQTPAALRWISIEPMLGPVDLSNICVTVAPGDVKSFADLDAVVLGGETGPGARPMQPDWVRTVRDQCHFAGMPFFFKGWGKHMPPGDAVLGRELKSPLEVFLADDRRLLDGCEHNDLPWRLPSPETSA